MFITGTQILIPNKFRTKVPAEFKAYKIRMQIYSKYCEETIWKATLLLSKGKL